MAIFEICFTLYVLIGIMGTLYAKVWHEYPECPQLAVVLSVFCWPFGVVAALFERFK